MIQNCLRLLLSISSLLIFPLIPYFTVYSLKIISIKLMETTNFGFIASLLFVGVPTIFLIGLFISTSDGEKSSFYSDSSKGRLGPKPKN